MIHYWIVKATTHHGTTKRPIEIYVHKVGTSGGRNPYIELEIPGQEIRMTPAQARLLMKHLNDRLDALERDELAFQEANR